MNYEKAYKEALERAREFQKSKDGLCVLTAESIFPELQESDDEKIRKSLINVFSNRKKYLIDQSFGDSKVKDILAWLEKQGQKSTLSDEDKMMLNELIIGFCAYKDLYPNFWKLRTDEIIEWLKKKKDEHTTDNG